MRVIYLIPKKNDTEYSNPDLIVSEDTGSGLDVSGK